MKNLKQGTPKSLDQAIRNGLLALPFTKLDLDDSIVETNLTETHAHIRDFLAQHFSSAMMSAKTDDESARLDRLFKSLVGELK